MSRPAYASGIAALALLMAGCSEPETEEQPETADAYSDRIDAQTGEPRQAANNPARRPGASVARQTAAGTGSSAANSTDVLSPTIVPTGFTGSWAPSLGECAASSESRITIRPGSFSFHESRGKVHSVRQDRPGSMIVAMTMTGEGESWEEVTMFDMNPGGQTMSRSDPLDSEAPTIRYQRCPE